MRVFIVLCIVAVACADKLGYNYQPVGHSGSGLSFNPGSGIDGSGLIGSGLGGSGLGDSGLGGSGLGDSGLIGSGLAGSGLGGAGLGGSGLGGSGLGGSGLGASGLGGSGLGGSGLGGSGLTRPGLIGSGLGGGNDGPFERLGGDSSLGGLRDGIERGGVTGGFGDLGDQPAGALNAPVAYNAPAPSAELDKEFFTYTANEQDFDEPQASEKISNSLNKALRVVFIKGPENRGLENAALALAKQAAEQRTAIYVLNKQTDIGELSQKLNAIRSNSNNKPEVHFVKYRTPEDALNAQRAIQGQYDQLGGRSSQRDGGVAPVLNFASRAASPGRESIAASAPGPSYLPANIFRRLRY